MKLLNHTADKVTLELTRHKLHMVSVLIQEGRYESAEDEAKSRGCSIRSILMSGEGSRDD
ncbi:MAG: hypothetical protein ACJAS1_006091 [Oleiphilaceae bacterium]|jgi:hypothetical protein